MEHPCCPQVDSAGLLRREVLQPATNWLAGASLICMQQSASQLLPEPGPRAHDSSANTDCIVRSNVAARAAALMARFMESDTSMIGQVAEYCDLHHDLRSDENHSPHCAKVREKMYLSRQAWSILRHPVGKAHGLFAPIPCSTCFSGRKTWLHKGLNRSGTVRC